MFGCDVAVSSSATRMSKEEFKRRYPNSETAGSDFAPIGGFLAPSWLRGDEITIAEYWQVELEKKKLSMYRGIPEPEEDDYQTDAPAALTGPAQAANQNLNKPGLNGFPPPPGAPAGSPAPGGLPGPGGLGAAAPQASPPPPPPDADEQGYVVRGFYDDEEVPDGFEAMEDDDGEPIGRDVEIRHVWRYDTNGHEILGKPKPWAGKYIPIVPVFGKEKIVEGKRYLMSAIRFALDPQQLYNFYKTGEAEVIQQTPKNPYVGVLGQFKTMQMQWAEANVVPRSTLEYDPVVVGGELAPPPQRQQYEPATQALTIGAAAANEDIKATTGLFDPSRGQANSNADTGVAIGLLQQQGATATYHFFDNFLRSMWHGYRILIDLIPKIYDTPRVIRIVRPDDEAELVQINRMFTGKDGKRIKYDLGLGTYAIALSVQPSYQTQKQQNAAQLGELAKADPAQLPLWSDLYIKQLDLGPLGDEIADRLTPPQYRKPGQDPQQLQQQAAQLAQQNQALTAQLHALAQQLETKQYESQQKDAANQRDNQTKLQMTMMQEQTQRQSDAIKLAIAEMQAKAQTGARAFSDMLAVQTEREAMAHELGMAAHTRSLALHDAANLPAGLPGAQAAPPDPNDPNAPDQSGPDQNAQPGGIPSASVNPAAFNQVSTPPPL